MNWQNRVTAADACTVALAVGASAQLRDVPKFSHLTTARQNQ